MITNARSIDKYPAETDRLASQPLVAKTQVLGINILTDDGLLDFEMYTNEHNFKLLNN